MVNTYGTNKRLRVPVAVVEAKMLVRPPRHVQTSKQPHTHTQNPFRFSRSDLFQGLRTDMHKKDPTYLQCSQGHSPIWVCMVKS